MEIKRETGEANCLRTIGFSEKIKRCVNRVRQNGCSSIAGGFEQLHPLIAEARKELALASDETISRLLDVNPLIVRAVSRDGTMATAFGLFAYLPLNAAGANALGEGNFSGLDPEPSWICREGESPAAIYFWLFYFPGNLASAVGVVAQVLDEVTPQGCAVFSRAVNAHAERLNKTIGFIDAKPYFPNASPGLLVIFPQKQPTQAASETARVRIARTVEDFCQVMAVRSATYLAEQYCLYEEEFDGNDLCSTQFLGFIGGDPAGCVRARFFAGFAKIERLAVRAEYRNSRLAYELVRASIRHCQLKGYTTLYGHSRLDLVRFWRVFGFRERGDRPDFAFANVRYMEMVLELPPLAEAITLEAEPMVLIRPEGAWDRPGPLDRSRSADDPKRKSMLIEKTRTISRMDIASDR